MTRILGVDPGSQRTGVGIIDVDAAGRPRHVFHAALNLLGQEHFAGRLKQLFDELGAIVAEYAPQEAAMERVFMAKNPDSALKLGQARGAAICALAQHGLGIREYAAREVKQAVVGTGAGDKAQVQHINARGEYTPRNLQTADERANQVFAVRVELIEGKDKLHAGMSATVQVPRE